jgi:putative FmdB family regulatory protein
VITPRFYGVPRARPAGLLPFAAMPIYEYVCGKCHRKTEVIQRMNEAPLKVCPHCGGKLKKAFSAPAIQFKGSGWYVTDYARAKSETGGKSAKSEKSESAGSAADSGDKAENADRASDRAKAEKSAKSEKKDKGEKKKSRGSDS